MNKLQELLTSEKIILLDGAMGTMLMMAGLEQGAPPESWNLLYPERVQNVHQQYIDAGTRLIVTNSFGGTRFRLKLHQLDNQVAAVNRAAAQIGRAAADAAPHSVIVAGSMGPTGELLEPMGTMTMAEAEAAFAEQAAALADGGVDVLWIETMSDLNEVKAAVAGARSVSDLPIAASMTFDTHGHTMMGVSPTQALQELSTLGLAAIGANCGNGPAEIKAVIKEMHALAPETVLIAKANAGIPKWKDDALTYDGTPAVMGLYTDQVRELGAQLIGGCCGSTPDHIRAMRAVLDGAEPLVEQMPKTAVSTPKQTAKNGRSRHHRRTKK